MRTSSREKSWFRYDPSEGNDLYLVYNERLHTDRSVRISVYRRGPVARSLLKYTYTFDW